jgi:hypothetical protein
MWYRSLNTTGQDGRSKSASTSDEPLANSFSGNTFPKAFMNVKLIRNEVDLHAAFKRLEVVYQAQEGTSKSDEMEIFVTLIDREQVFPNGGGRFR